MKLPRLENQRGYLRCVLMHAASFDLTHEDHVIAFLITAPVMALEPRERAIEHGHACVPGGVRHTCKAVALDRREALAEIDLRRGEHIDHVVTVGLEYGHRCRLCCKAPQYERRIQRYGIERAGRDANQLARLGARGDDGDAGGELAERVPESVCIEIRRISAFHWDSVSMSSEDCNCCDSIGIDCAANNEAAVSQASCATRIHENQ